MVLSIFLLFGCSSKREEALKLFEFEVKNSHIESFTIFESHDQAPLEINLTDDLINFWEQQIRTMEVVLRDSDFIKINAREVVGGFVINSKNGNSLDLLLMRDRGEFMKEGEVMEKFDGVFAAYSDELTLFFKNK